MAKNKEEAIEKMVEMLRSDTYTIAEICRAVGIATRTYHEWQSGDEDFARAINDAKKSVCSILLQRQRKAY